MDRTQAEQLIDWMNPEQKPDQVVKIVKRAAFLFSNYHKDHSIRSTYYVRIDLGVEWRLGNTEFSQVSNGLISPSVFCLVTLHFTHNISARLCPYARRDVFFFFFFFGRCGRVGCRWNHEFRGRLVALEPIPSNSMDFISPVKFGFLTPH